MLSKPSWKYHKIKMKTLILLCSIYLICFSANTGAAADKKKKKQQHGFLVGQIPLGRFEYPGLDGILKPVQAQIICENDLECAGFTFKGAKTGLDIPHPIIFFRYVSDKTFSEIGTSNNPKTFLWTSYRVKRAFVIVAGSKFPESKVVRDTNYTILAVKGSS